MKYFLISISIAIAIFSIINLTPIVVNAVSLGNQQRRATENVTDDHPPDVGEPKKDDLSTAWAKQIIRRAKVADIHGILNPKVDPCDDFYEYACGNWHRSNPAQLLNNVITDKFQLIAKAFDRRLEKILNMATDVNELEGKVRDFYQACKVVKLYAVHYKLALENVYKEFGELPVLAGEHWNEEEFNWWETIAKIQHKYGKQIILAVDILGDIKNNTENKVYVGPPDYSLTTNSKFLSLLQEATIVKDLEKNFGVEHSLAKQTAKELLEFERALIKGGTDSRSGAGLGDLLTLKSVAELKETYADSLDMERYLEIIFGSNVPESVYIYDEKYFEGVLNTVTETPNRTVANYILWHLLHEYRVDAAEKDLPKWCVDMTKKYFGKYVDHMVYQSYRSEKTEQEVIKVWTEIQATFRDELSGDKLDWISNGTREYALEKLNAMKLFINAYDDVDFAAEFGELDLDRLDYVHNIQQILMQDSKRKFHKLNETATTLEAPDVLSYTPAYNILENSIKIPVGLLQPRYLWDDNYPQALKYATLGYLIAHEMVHGFDDEGRQYDKHGNAHNWWDVKSTYEFDERRKCFQAQYHNYKYGGRQLPESIGQSENIADNAGVKLAYAAYVRWLNTQKLNDPDIESKELLPGLNFDNRQLFFISFAQVWCDDVQSLFKSSIVSSDTHAPGMYRVIGSLSNFQEFSWIFHCKQDAAMDPEFKCSIY